MAWLLKKMAGKMGRKALTQFKDDLMHTCPDCGLEWKWDDLPSAKQLARALVLSDRLRDAAATVGKFMFLPDNAGDLCNSCLKTYVG